ncbi:MAG: hypothetical protein H3C41_00585, partial [Bacteroidales bacterium]|nr:hypothetical protein [Bacteroidales bacterium]
MKRNLIHSIAALFLTAMILMLIVPGCGKKGKGTGGDQLGAPYGKESFGDVVKRRGLNADDVLAAAKTFTPDNIEDEYIALNSGGQAG